MDPNAHSFSSSSVMTYSKKGDEPPKVFQASAQTRTGPGGVSGFSFEINQQTLTGKTYGVQNLTYGQLQTTDI